MRAADLLPTYEQLAALDDLEALFTAAADLAAGVLLADRAVVAAVVDGRIGTPAGASRRGAALLTAVRDVAVAPWADRERTERPPDLRAAAATLHHPVAAWIAPDGPPVAMLVADRARSAFGARERQDAGEVAAVVAIAVERAVLRRRARAFAAEVSRFGAVARGMATEVLDTEPVLPSAVAPVLPGPTAGGVLELLTPREKRVAILLSEGRSNAAIAEVLLLSPETVKAHAARIRRKLGAANRVELIATILEGTRS